MRIRLRTALAGSIARLAVAFGPLAALAYVPTAAQLGPLWAALLVGCAFACAVVLRAGCHSEQTLLSPGHAVSAQHLDAAMAQERGFAHAVLEAAGAVIVVLDPTGRIVHFNHACEELTGIAAAEARGRSFWELVIPAEDQAALRELFAAPDPARFPRTGESAWLTRDRGRRVIAWTNTVICDEAGALRYVVSCGLDLGQRIVTERYLRTANRMLQMIRAVNYAMAASPSEEALLQQACATVIAQGGYALAWVGLAEHSGERRVVPIAWAGSAAVIVPDLGITWADGPRSQAPSARAIRDRRPIVVPDVLADEGMRPWHAAAREVGLAAVVALPLVADDRLIGVLSVGAGTAEAFSADDIGLLDELAHDLAYGVMAQRARVARDVAERDLRQVLQDLEERVAARTAELSALNAQLAGELQGRQVMLATLHEREQFIERIADAVPGLLYVYDLLAQRTIYINAGLTGTLGYSCDAAEGAGEERFLSLVHPDEREQFTTLRARLALARDGEVLACEYRLRGADGAWHWLAVRNSIFTRSADGQPAQILGTALDITERKDAEIALAAAHERLQLTADTLQRRADELALLGETSDLLHHCQSMAEAYGVIGQAARHLFPSSSGVLSIRRSSEPLLEPMLVWGELPETPQPFHPDRCWALRGGAVHMVDPTRIAPPCEHSPPRAEHTTLCAPVALPGQAHGLIQLWFPRDSQADPLAWVQQLALWERLANALARQIALALANLQQRAALAVALLPAASEEAERRL